MRQGLLIGTTYQLTLTPQEAAALVHVADHSSGDQAGGWQSLVRSLRSQLKGCLLEVDEYELARVDRYISHYGGGGYQDALKGVRRAGWAAGWQQ